MLDINHGTAPQYLNTDLSVLVFDRRTLRVTLYKC